MKIVFLTSYYCNAGGLEKHLSLLTNHLSKEHEVHFICTHLFPRESSLPKPHYFFEQKIHFHHFYRDSSQELVIRKENNKFYKELLDNFSEADFDLNIIQQNIETIWSKKVSPKLEFYIPNLLKKIKPDCAVVCSSYSLAYLPIVIQQKIPSLFMEASYPLIYKGCILDESSIQSKKQFLEFFAKNTKIIVQNQATQKAYKKYFNISSVAIKNPVVSINKQTKNPILLNAKKQQIIVCGRLCKIKQPSIILKAFLRIASQHPSWKLFFYGGFEDKKIIKEMQYLIDRDKMNHQIKIMEAIENKKMFQVLQESSLLVHASFFEGTPNALLEALNGSCCCVVLAQPMTAGVYQEILGDNKYGIIVKPKWLKTTNATNFVAITPLQEDENITLLSKKLDEILNDDKTQKHYQKIAPQAIQDQSVDEIGKQWEQALLQQTKHNLPENIAKKEFQILTLQNFLTSFSMEVNIKNLLKTSVFLCKVFLKYPNLNKRKILIHFCRSLFKGKFLFIKKLILRLS